VSDLPLNNVDEAADPLEMFSGQFIQRSTDLRIAGAGMDFVFERTYRNQAVYAGPLGAYWDHWYNLRLRESGLLIIRTSGELRSDLYRQHPRFGQAGFSYWVPPDGEHGIIEQSGTSFVWRSPEGVRIIYAGDVAHQTLHRIQRIEDRFSNYLAFSYDEEHLHRVEVNHLARSVVFDV
jgi:Domain of unknown function (DUF6531)